jgi:hypothetical protein
MANSPSASWRTFGIVLILAAQAPAAERPQKRTFDECFLYQDAQGTVWVGQPLVSLGMIGVMGNAPLYRLSPAVAKRLAALVNDVELPAGGPEFWWWGFPTPKDERPTTILVRLETTAELRQPEVTPAFGVTSPAGGTVELGRPAIYEVTSAKLVYAEFVSPEWRQAWETLTAGLKEIVAVSRTAPGRRKTQRLASAIDRASRAYHTMVETKVSGRSRAIVQDIDPDARAVRLFQRNVEDSGWWAWGGQLRHYVATLGIAPRTPLPPEPQPCPKTELLAASRSAPEFLDRIRRSWPEETLDDRLIYSQDLDRMVLVWQVERLAPAQFEALRRQAREELARRAPSQPSAVSPSTSPDTPPTKPEWNVVLAPAGADRLAENGLLRGSVVKEVRGDALPARLQAGDIIVDYETTYDVVMRREPLSGKTRLSGKLDVLRGDRILTLEIKKP